jgi:DNA-directed RNA polymerase subunit RPC12/RpoP
MDLHQYGVELTCPTCTRKFTASVGALNENPRVACPGCTQPILVPTEQIRAAIKAIEGGES